MYILSKSSDDFEMHSEKLWINPSLTPPGTAGGNDIFWTRR